MAEQQGSDELPQGSSGGAREAVEAVEAVEGGDDQQSEAVRQEPTPARSAKKVIS